MPMSTADALTEALRLLKLKVVPAEPHTQDADCAPFLVGEEIDVQECSVCGVLHGDACPFCDRRGFHADDCPWIAEGVRP